MQQQRKQEPLQPPLALQALVPAMFRDRHIRSSCGNGPMLRRRYAPRTAHDSASRGCQPCAVPTGRREVRLPVGLQESVSHSSMTSGVDTLLDLLTQKMIAQDHFARHHAGNGFDPPPDLLADTGGK